MVSPNRRYRRPDLLPVQERWQRTFHRRARIRMNDLRGRVAPITDHIRDHGFSWAAMGCIDASCFVHSVFTGLLVTGILLVVFELKISE